MGAPKTKDLFAEINKSIVDLVGVVGKLNDRLSALESVEKQAPVKVVEPDKLADQAPAVPVPQEYRDLVDRALNGKFGIRLEPCVNPLEFLFAILVPKEYSSVSDGHWQMYKEDARQRRIEVVAKDAQIKEHLDKIFNSLDQVVQQMVISQRVLV